LITFLQSQIVPELYGKELKQLTVYLLEINYIIKYSPAFFDGLEALCTLYSPIFQRKKE